MINEADMASSKLGASYDKIATWWQQQHDQSDYGLAQIERAISFCNKHDQVLDVGCGCGGRITRLLVKQSFSVTGIDISTEMIRLARQAHPEETFLVQDICRFVTSQNFDLIIAWDSIFHLPLHQQRPVVTRLCQLLAPDGVLVYSFGDAVEGEHDSEWHDDKFHYSTIGIDGNLQLLTEQGVTCTHLELDQWPENHAYLITVKRSDPD